MRQRLYELYNCARVQLKLDNSVIALFSANQNSERAEAMSSESPLLSSSQGADNVYSSYREVCHNETKPSWLSIWNIVDI